MKGVATALLLGGLVLGAIGLVLFFVFLVVVLIPSSIWGVLKSFRRKVEA